MKKDNYTVILFAFNGSFAGTWQQVTQERAAEVVDNLKKDHVYNDGKRYAVFCGGVMVDSGVIMEG